MTQNMMEYRDRYFVVAKVAIDFLKQAIVTCSVSMETLTTASNEQRSPSTTYFL